MDPDRGLGAEGAGQRLVAWTPEVLRSALFNALAAGRPADVALCLERGAGAGWRDEGAGTSGMTALQAAVAGRGPPRAKAALVELLLAEGAELEAVDYAEATALHFAAALGEPEVVRLLVAKGASPRVWDSETLTPLHLAANNGHLAAAEALTANWAPVDLADAVETAAEAEPDPHVRQNLRARRLAPQGAGNLYAAKRGTPLHVCAAANRLAIARHLVVRARADVNNAEGAHGSAPLHIAARCGHREICELLLDHGAAAEAEDERGERPLHRAVEGGHREVVGLLLRRGATADCRNAVGLTPLHVAAAAGRPELCRLLLARGAACDAPCAAEYEDWDGRRTPLHYAAHWGHLEVCRLLRDHGADVRALSSVGWPPLFYAVEAKQADVVEWIMDLDEAEGLHFTDDRNRTPLMVAAMQDAADLAEAIVERHPFTLDWRDDRGRTAFHWAATRGHANVMDKLMRLGAATGLRDADGKTAGDLFPYLTRPPPKRQWEEERMGAEGEARWDYAAVMEATQFRYMKCVMVARREREVASERQCHWCQRFSFDAMRCGGCKAAFYCNSVCQRLHWTKGGHRLACLSVEARAKAKQQQAAQCVAAS